MRATANALPLRLEDVSFTARGALLVDRLSLTVRPHRRLVLLGPNGAGKTLTLRLCGGLILPTAGRLVWADERRAPLARAMVFQRPVLLRRSAFANLIHPLRLRGHGPAVSRRRAEAAVERFGLGLLAARPARLLSGGEQQRLAIARAWALRPEVLFLDEPTSQLDPAATRAVETMIGDVASEGVTIVMTTQDLGQARRLGEDIALMHRGRLVEAGPAAAFFDRPATAEARAFLGGDLLW